MTLYGATRDRDTLDEAVRAARWLVADRALPGGGFRHDAIERSGPYLGDTVSMARAFGALYGATGDRQWLAHAQSAIQFINKNFRDAQDAGFLTAKAPSIMATRRILSATKT